MIKLDELELTTSLNLTLSGRFSKNVFNHFEPSSILKAHVTISDKGYVRIDDVQEFSEDGVMLREINIYNKANVSLKWKFIRAAQQIYKDFEAGNMQKIIKKDDFEMIM